MRTRRTVHSRGAGGHGERAIVSCPRSISRRSSTRARSAPSAMASFWSGSPRGAARRRRRRSRSWSSGTRRWCWRPAGNCWATCTMPRTPPRRRSWCWRRRPGRSGAARRSAAGCTPSRCGSRPRRRWPPPGAGSTNSEVPRWRCRARRPRTRPIAGPSCISQIDRLPDRLRLPIVLCYLEGLTHAEAAHQLGWPVGTVESRLARGRERLKERLTGSRCHGDDPVGARRQRHRRPGSKPPPGPRRGSPPVMRRRPWPRPTSPRWPAG